MSARPIPVTVFTGFLGAGKTTILLALLSQIPKDYKVAVLKNEFGDVAVDSQLIEATAAASSNNGGGDGGTTESVRVTEMLNGCLCCVLVGQMKNALLDIRDKYNPDRIIVETSGSAFPAPIAWQIRQLNDEGFTLDAIITVIDCVNFTGYEDTSYTAKMQAKYTDVILLNKHELISERQFDLVLDHVYELNEETPKIKCNMDKGVSPNLIFGIDTKLFQIATEGEDGGIESNVAGGSTEWLTSDHHANEADLMQIVFPPPSGSHCEPGCTHEHGDQYAHDHGEGKNVDAPARLFTEASLEAFLKPLPSDTFYRIKGAIRIQNDAGDSRLYIINWAFGRYTLTSVSEKKGVTQPETVFKITVMGVDMRMWINRIADGFGFPSANMDVLKDAGVIKFTAARRP
ncbi:CobW/HypB/UreG, nucleotide-binding domain-containing protein [Chytriomyces sp. MP71]|nr:CobW/HypB/UreG, nucleotide-binding domain-containing protein [Chytriomyces sp. MP71]